MVWLAWLAAGSAGAAPAPKLAVARASAMERVTGFFNMGYGLEWITLRFYANAR